MFVTQATGTLTVGTVRQTDLIAAAESALSMDLGGCLIQGVDMVWNARPVTTGASSCVTAFFRGPSTLDVGDINPNGNPNDAWIRHKRYLTYGTRHLVATTPTLEFDQVRDHYRVATKMRLRGFADTLWFAEDSVGQNWEAQWSARIWVSTS